MSDLTLGIDIGTSGIRTAVIDQSGVPISSARVAHAPQDENNIDASLWWLSVQNCIQEQAEALKDAGFDFEQIKRIGVDGTSGTMVLVDENLTPVTRALMYNSSGFDEEGRKIASCAPPIHITKGSNSALARAIRLQSEDQSGKAVHLLHQADYIAAKFLGFGGHSDHNNALKTGFDPELESWPAWFESTGLKMSLLPKVHPAGAHLDVIARGVADDLGLASDVQIHAGTTDSIAAFLAAAPLEMDVAVTSLGTTLAIKILCKTRIDDPEIGLYSHKLGDFWLVGGASNTGGGVLAAHFNADDLRRLSGQIDAAQASPLDYYPLMKPGERFPVNDPDLAPRLDPRPDDDAEFLHGLLESIARIESQCYNAIAERGGNLPRLLMTAGGGAQNDVWTQIRTRVLGLAPKDAPHAEAAIGVAKLVQHES